MFSFIFQNLLYNPLYNLLIFLGLILPGNDIGLAIITLTLIIKTVILPISHKANRLQKKIKEIDPAIKEIRKKCQDKEEQTKQLMELYKNHGVNPLTSILLLFIQMPIILTLFYLFYKGFEYRLDIIYPFLQTISTDIFSVDFLGLLNVNEPYLLAAFLVGLTQFIQINISLPPVKIDKNKKELDFKDNLSKSFSLQMRYVMPFIFIFIAAKLPLAVCLYWITSNLFTIGHELFFKKKVKDISKTC